MLNALSLGNLNLDGHTPQHTTKGKGGGAFLFLLGQFVQKWKR